MNKKKKKFLCSSNHEPYIHVKLISPKTNKNGIQTTVAKYHCDKNPLICPYHVLWDYLNYKDKIIKKMERNFKILYEKKNSL